MKNHLSKFMLGIVMVAAFSGEAFAQVACTALTATSNCANHNASSTDCNNAYQSLNTACAQAASQSACSSAGGQWVPFPGGYICSCPVTNTTCVYVANTYCTAAYGDACT